MSMKKSDRQSNWRVSFDLYGHSVGPESARNEKERREREFEIGR
jgi:hypothetical protein